MITTPIKLTTASRNYFRIPVLCFISSFPLMDVGCTPRAASPSPAVNSTTSTNVPKGELVDNPDFLCWNRFPVDSQVIRKREIVSAEGKVEVVTTLTLRTKSEKKITVDQQVTVKRPESTLENEPQSLEYAAKFELPASMSVESFSLPSLKAKRTGSEEIEILGKTYTADVFEWVEVNEGGPMSVKLWRCDEIPGRTAKEESLVKDGAGRFLEEVTEINIPDVQD
jgi:hypothetical protein